MGHGVMGPGGFAERGRKPYPVGILVGRVNAMTTAKLNDALMGQYIRDGYVTVETGLPREFHAELFRKTDEVFEKEGNPGNNLVPRLPDVGRVLDDPAVTGALAGILGGDYFMEPHRHPHYNQPGSAGQELHKDSFTRRRHRTRRALAFYYPQDTTEDMGPTAVVPGSHYYNTSEGALDAGGEVLVTVKAGTVVIANYDIWHRGTANRSDRPRYMMKFLVARMSEPGAPSSNGGSAAAGDGERHAAMRRHMWGWHSGTVVENGASNGGSVDRLADVVAGGSERDAIDAAYELGASGAAAVPALVELLDDDSGSEWWEQKASSIKGRGLTSPSANASYGLTAAGPPAVPALVERTTDARWWLRATAAETLGDIGPPAAEALPALIDLAADEVTEVRAEAVHALGTVGQRGADAAPALARALADEEASVRREASLALARTGERAGAAASALIAALGDEDRYVRGNSVHALYLIDSADARDALLRYLMASRWCHSTTKDSTY